MTKQLCLIGGGSHLELRGLAALLGYREILTITAEDIVDLSAGAGDIFIAEEKPSIREKLTLSMADRSAPVLLDPGVRCGADTFIGDGSYVGPGVILGADAKIGEHVIIHAGSLIGEGTSVGKGTVIGQGANIGRGVTIGADCKLAPGVILRDAVTIREGTILAEGEIVLKDLVTKMVYKRGRWVYKEEG